MPVSGFKIYAHGIAEKLLAGEDSNIDMVIDAT